MAAVMAVWLWTPPVSSYEIRESGLHVRSRDHWAMWRYPAQAVAIDSSTGLVRLRRLRTDVDAVRDARRFERPIGEATEYQKLLRSLAREQRAAPLNAYRRPATVAGVPLTRVRQDPRGDAIPEPVEWYFLHGGVSAAGTNPQAAPHAAEGDASTCWEPLSAVTPEEYAGLPREDKGEVYYLAAAADGRMRRVSPPAYEATPEDRRRMEFHSRSTKSWYLDLDLGRVVAARRVVLRFAPEGTGDPFRQVRLLSSPFSSLHEPYSLLARTTQAITRRQLAFDLDPEGDGYVLLHRLRIAVSDSRLERAAVVSPAAFAALAPQDQGAVDYYIYDALGGERRGRRRYYRRERPCLSEVEVWTQGDNVALGLGEGGGDVSLPGSFTVDHGFDGLYDTYFTQRLWRPEAQADLDRWILTIDLGATYRLNHLRFLRRCCRREETVTVEAADASRDAAGGLRWRPLLRDKNEYNEAAYGDQTIEMPLTAAHPVRFLRSHVQQDFANPAFETRELQLFGEGHAAAAELTSPLIELPGAVVADRIWWEADLPDPAATRVEVRTRFGDRLQEETLYFNSAGYPVTSEKHSRLPASFRGPVVTRQGPGAGWSPWSSAYRRSGGRVSAAGPRKYLQLQVRLSTADPAATPSIRAIEVSLRPPVASRITAEIWPESVEAGHLDTFDLYIQPGFVEHSPTGRPSIGFDEIRVDPGSMAGMELLELQIGELRLQADPGRPGLLTGPSPADSVRVIQGGAAGRQLRLRLAQSLGPAQDARRVYHRIVRRAGDQVPVDGDGRPLLERAYLDLPEKQRGRELYLRLVTDAVGRARVDSVDRLTYLGLPASLQAGVRFFRRVDSGEFPFDRAGAPLTRDAYLGLPAAERGRIQAEGDLLRLRLRGTVVRYGTSLNVEVRQSSQNVWQRVDPADATELSPGTGLTIRVPLRRRILQQLQIGPSTITPNGDGVNDVARIRFLVTKATMPRPLEVEIFDLAGRRVRHLCDRGARSVLMHWDGRDDKGRLVPPGIYLCRVHVQTDAGRPEIDARAIAVAY